MEQLIELLQGLLNGEFKLKEYTRSNKENDNNTITMSFGFDVELTSKSQSGNKNQRDKEPTKRNVIIEANRLFIDASNSIGIDDIKSNPTLVHELAGLLDVILK